MRVRDAVRSAASSPPAAWLVSALERLDGGRHDTLAVVTYHHIVDGSAAPGDHGVHSTSLEAHLEALLRRYAPVSLEDVVDARHGARRLPRRPLLVTFDDAYRDFASVAWPIIRSRGVPAAVFVPTGYPDRPDRWLWWDRLTEAIGAARGDSLATPLGSLSIATPRDRQLAHRRLRDHGKRIGVEASVAMTSELAESVGLAAPTNGVLGWEELRGLAREGVSIAPHSRSHPLLPTLSDAELEVELTGSRADVVREIGGTAPAFAVPAGAWDQRVLAATADAGYEIAFTTDRGVNDLRRDGWLRLRRVNVGDRTNATLLRAQLGRWMGVRSMG